MNEHMDDKTVPKAIVFGFDQATTALLSETLFFAGAEASQPSDAIALKKELEEEPPLLAVMPVKTIRELELDAMLAGDPRFDRVNLIAAAHDAYDPELREVLDKCAVDYFLVSQPYHIKRLTMAVMSRNPWAETPTSSGRILIAEGNMEVRSGIARVMRIAHFDVVFADDPQDMVKRLGAGEGLSMVIASQVLGTDELFSRCQADRAVKHLPWIVYGDGGVRTNAAESADRLARIGNDTSADAILFHVQDIMRKPLKDMRQSRRLPMFAPVRFHVERLREPIWAFSRDMSLNGLYVRTIIPPPAETILTVRFRAPTGDGSVQATARVAWRKDFGQGRDPMKPAGMGIQFVRLSRPDQAAFEAGYNALCEIAGPEPEASK